MAPHASPSPGVDHLASPVARRRAAGTEYLESRVALSILEELSSAIQEGVETHRLQLNPHLTLLEDSFYHSRLKPLLVQWMIVSVVA